MPIASTRLEILQIRKLLQCVDAKDYKQIEKLIKNGVEQLVNYNEPDEGQTCLILATVKNDHETIQMLLNNGAHPDVVDFQGRSAIMIAATYGHVKSFELLIKGKADLKLCDRNGKNVLFYCISSSERHTECVKLALSHDVDINAAAKDGKTVLINACESVEDNEEMCMLLLENGADVKIKQPATGKNALMTACGSKSANSNVVSKCLRLGANPNEVDRHDKTAVHYAAKVGNFRALVALAAFGAQLDVYDDSQSNPIHYAALTSGACCKYLGQRGCNPKVKNGKGELPKVIAKEAGAKDSMKELRKVEKSFGKVGKNNEPYAITLYDWIVERLPEINEEMKRLDPEDSGKVNKKEFIEVMNGMGAPITDQVEVRILPQFDKNKDGNFDYVDFLTGKKYINKLYLMSAFEGKKKKKKKGGKGKKRKTKIPFEIPVMPDSDIMRPMDGGPPVMFIPREQHSTDLNRYSSETKPINEIEDDCIWYLGDAKRQYINMNDAAKHGDLDSIKLALSKGYSVDTRDRYYKTPLMSAAKVGNLDICLALINLGADVNAKDNLHWTSLHHAAHSGMIDVIELLINSGANLEAKALNGATPLFRAIETSKINVVEYLIKRGAKVQSENRKGDTPMDVAYFWADPRVINAVRLKHDALPPIKDKKGKGSAKGRGRSKSPGKRVDPDAANKAAPIQSPEVPVRSASEIILRRATAALNRQAERQTDIDLEDVRFEPPRWTVAANQRATIEEQRRVKTERRERFGWEVDFPDVFQSNFHKNLMLRVNELEALE